jgi:hypothetical protein
MQLLNMDTKITWMYIASFHITHDYSVPFIPLRICKLDSTGSYFMLCLYHWLQGHLVVFCRSGSALDSVSRSNLEMLSARCHAADGLAVAVVVLAALGFDYLRGTTSEPWWW